MGTTGQSGLRGLCTLVCLAGLAEPALATRTLLPVPQDTAVVQRFAQNDADELTQILSKATPDAAAWLTNLYAGDQNGNLTNAAGLMLAYDAENRVTNMVSGATTTVVTYDGQGNRVKRATVTAGVTNVTWFVLDYADSLRRPLAEVSTAGTPTRYFVWAGGLAAQVETNGVVRYVHADGQGSTLSLSDTNGLLTDQWFYSPYGSVLNRTGSIDSPFQWLGGYGVRCEGGGIYLTRYRAYHAGLMRFTNADPIGLAGGLNLFAYALGNPLLLFDPMGLCATTVGAVGSAGVLERAAQVRNNYNAWVAQYVTETGGYSPTRDAIRAYWNQPGNNSTALSRGVAEMYRWEQGLSGATPSMGSPASTAGAVNRAAAIAEYGGRSLIVIGAGMSVYDIATASDPYRATVQNGAAITVGTGGAIAGAWAGGGIGSAFPGPGTAIGAVVGAVVGGIVGGFGGDELGGAAYDANYGPSSPWYPSNP